MTRRNAIIGSAAGLLTAQAGLTQWLSRTELLPSPGPLDENIPTTIGDWARFQDGVMDPAAFEVLAPDDVLNRVYRQSAAGSDLSLFISYYRTQLRAKNAHDPKVCLPGSGWNPLISKQIPIAVEGLDKPIEVNYYVIARGGETAVVLYWFQNHKTAYATEQGLKFSRIVDNIMENRTDMALVRIIVSATKLGVDPATASASEFSQRLYPYLKNHFPAA
jgi:EpsI family protein